MSENQLHIEKYPMNIATGSIIFKFAWTSLDRRLCCMLFYCPPSYNTNDFFSKLESMLASSRSYVCAIIGDINIPINISTCSIVQEYLSLLNCYNFTPTNTYPTRLASSNILDHVICSEALQSCVVNETVYCEISDHCYVLSTFSLLKPLSEKVLKTTIVDHMRLNNAFVASVNQMPKSLAEDKLKHVIQSYNNSRYRFSKVVTMNTLRKKSCEIFFYLEMIS